MARRLLLDTGFLVALVNGDDPDHVRCASVWSELRARLVSVEGVLVEAAHLLRRDRNGPGAAVALVLAAGTQLVPATEPRLERAIALMAKYADVPMNLTDALLVVTAEEQSIREILTLDHRGFETYRVGRRERFQLLP